MTVVLFPKKKSARQRFAFSTMSAVLAVIATASALLFVHEWGKGAIAPIEWVCGTSAVLLLASIIVDSRRP